MNGYLKDVTVQKNKGLQNIGMVTAGLWTDFDNDGWKDLIVTGEWMSIHFYKNVKDNTGKRVLKEVSDQTGLSQTTGWWNSIAGADFDKDGDMDYLLGNQGLNSGYQPTDVHPLTICQSDLDQNRSIDPLMAAYTNNKEGEIVAYPVHARDDAIKQMVKLKKRFPDYQSYGRATYDELLNNYPDAAYLKANNFTSSYLENKGNGNFELRALPVICQRSPIKGILIEDFNDDNHLDAILVGNDFTTQSTNGYQDGSIGVFLQGDGAGNFRPLTNKESGLNVSGDSRTIIKTIDENGAPQYLVSQNSGKLKTYQLSTKNKDLIFFDPSDNHAIVEEKSGKIWRVEIYNGGSYLAQSVPYLPISDQIKKVTVLKKDGTKKLINLNFYTSYEHDSSK